MQTFHVHTQELDPMRILRPDVAKQVPAFFAKLPVVQRARWRWIFPEPSDSLSYPRQRARREMEAGADFIKAETLAMDDESIARHNKVAPVFQVGPQAAIDWAASCLTTTNKVYDRVPPVPRETGMWTSIPIWLRMIELAHAEGLLQPGVAMDVIRRWATGSTERERSALSNILLLFQDFMVASKGGQSETKISYMPKAIKPREPAEPPECQLGRPSSAPIVSAVHLKLEARLAAKDAKRIKDAQEMIAARAAEAPTAQKAAKGEHPTYKTSIPMKWPMKPPTLETTSQGQQRCVKAGDAATSRCEQSTAGNPPASYFNRHIGGPKWHGNTYYPQLTQLALNNYPPILYRPTHCRDLDGVKRTHTYALTIPSC